VAEDFNEVFGNGSFYYVLSLFSKAKQLVDHLDPRIAKERQVRK
jgi:hypothetical protein